MIHVGLSDRHKWDVWTHTS